MTKSIANLTTWDNLITDDKLKIINDFDLPANLKFIRLIRFCQGDQSHELAYFKNDHGIFALIPGGHTTLGQNPEDFHPSDEITKEFQESIDSFGFPDFSEYLKNIFRPVRQVEMRPFFIEVMANKIGGKKISDNKTDLGGIMTFSGDGFIEKDSSGTYLIKPISFNEAKSLLKATCYSFPTVDQWEYACRGGTRTIFRWGNTIPLDGYPIKPTQFKGHLQENSFGLVISRNPYDWEWTESSDFVGGDGGEMICGGRGFVVGWLTLASAFKLNYKTDPNQTYFSPFIRRVINF